MCVIVKENSNVQMIMTMMGKSKWVFKKRVVSNVKRKED